MTNTNIGRPEFESSCTVVLILAMYPHFSTVDIHLIQGSYCFNYTSYLAKLFEEIAACQQELN